MGAAGCATSLISATPGRPQEADYAADTDGRPGVAEIKLVAHPAAPGRPSVSAA
ncbi:hypothetical protein MAHJHV63_47420 [Mycobacterium avium subsp. hominissuis]